ncbi:glycosyltransferase family 4 protein [Vibrio breoganii]
MANICFISFSRVGHSGGPGQESKAIVESICEGNSVSLGCISVETKLSPEISPYPVPFGRVLTRFIDSIQRLLPRSSRLINEKILDLYISWKLDFEKIDVVVSSSFSPRVFKIARSKGIKTVFYSKNALNFYEISCKESEQWSIPMKFGEIDYLKDYNSIIDYTDHIISLNVDDRTWLEKNGRNNVGYNPINIGVDVTRFKNIDTQNSSEEPIFLYMGASPLRKGLNYILSYWTRNKVSHQLVVCGLGESDLQLYSNKYDSQNITYKGFVDPVSELENANVYLSPSLAEGQPRATFEAMAAGMTVIATGIGCGYHIESKVSGYILNDLTDYEFDLALSYVESRDTRERIGVTARNLALSKFTSENFGSQFKRILIDISNDK